MERKPGGYRSPSVATRVLSVDPRRAAQGVVPADLDRASPAPPPASTLRSYPLELAERLVRMFSFVGDTVLDPFMGTGTTSVAAAALGHAQHRRRSRSGVLRHGGPAHRGRHAEAFPQPHYRPARLNADPMLDIEKELQQGSPPLLDDTLAQKTRQGTATGRKDAGDSAAP
ncbi:MAG: site-specific DNA-methyltransferase [Rhodopseudomonas palustris]|nr:site-specific DNA-methyltransferase [Rhodopseudomonas palustris]